MALTLRNWLIGAYIHEYELRVQDRAQYGERLFERLGRRLTEIHIPNCNRSRLYRYRDFYLFYRQIREAIPPPDAPLAPALMEAEGKVATASPQSGSDKVGPPPLSGQLVLQRLS